MLYAGIKIDPIHCIVSSIVIPYRNVDGLQFDDTLGGGHIATQPTDTKGWTDLNYLPKIQLFNDADAWIILLL